MYTHLFPVHLRCRNQRGNPESSLTVTGAVLVALVIIIALALAVAIAVAAGAVV